MIRMTVGELGAPRAGTSPTVILIILIILVIIHLAFQACIEGRPLGAEVSNKLRRVR